MKKITALLLALTMLLGLSACGDEESSKKDDQPKLVTAYAIDTMTETDIFGNNTIFSFTYDDQGRLRSYVSQRLGEVITSVSYTYGQSGDWAEMIKTTKDGTTRTEIHRDSTGAPLEEQTYGQDGNLQSRKQYQYNDKGQLVKLIEFNAAGEELNTAEYIYDDAGVLLMKTSVGEESYSFCQYTYEDGRLVKKSDQTYGYDENGMLSEVDMKIVKYKITYKQMSLPQTQAGWLEDCVENFLSDYFPL